MQVNEGGGVANAELTSVNYDPRLHREGTHGSKGKCSWVEDCPHPPSQTVTIERPNGRRTTYALCDLHSRQAEHYFADKDY